MCWQSGLVPLLLGRSGAGFALLFWQKLCWWRWLCWPFGNTKTFLMCRLPWLTNPCVFTAVTGELFFCLKKIAQELCWIFWLLDWVCGRRKCSHLCGDTRLRPMTIALFICLSHWLYLLCVGTSCAHVWLSLSGQVWKQSGRVGLVIEEAIVKGASH